MTNQAPPALNADERPPEQDHSSRLNRLSSVPPSSGFQGSYQDLDGGFGREVNFRPPRYPSSEFGPIGAIVRATLDHGDERVCDVHDVSQNGVAFEWAEARALAVGDTIPVITVSFDQHEAYRGSARVGSVREIAGKQIVGVSFLDTLMNIDDVLQLRDVKAWSGGGKGLALKDRPWRVSGHERFKAKVAEMRLLLLDAEQQLGELSAALPWHVIHGDDESPARSALIERVRAEVVDEIVAAYVAVGSALEQPSPSEHQALREYSVRYLHDFFMQAPWVRRAKEKPLGYPGDYELMNGLYGNHFTGSSLFARVLNMAFVSVPAARAVRERKNVIKQKLSDLLDERRPLGRPIRILSIAAGPAQEVYELLHERDRVPYPLEIVLFDQDKLALAFSYARLKRLIARRWPDEVAIVYLHDTIKRLLKDPMLFSPLGDFDMIFCCGLFDYLPEPAAVSLSRTLFGRLAPRGMLYVGNQVPASTSRWAMEFHCDWHLIYREREEMLEFASRGAPEARVTIVEEPMGLNPFVVLTRE